MEFVRVNGLVFYFLAVLFSSRGIAAQKSHVLQAAKAFYLSINNETFHNVDVHSGFEFIPSVDGMPDLPKWMHFRHSNGSHAYLYGTPPRQENITIEVIALNTLTFETHRDLLNITILEPEIPAKYELQIRLNNLNIEDMFDPFRWDSFLSIFRESLWRESKLIYLSQVVAPSDIGLNLPVNPKDKEGTILRIASSDPYSRDLIDLEREVELIKNRNPCPRRYKFTRVEHLFRSKNFICDWCSFRIFGENLK